jgi:transcriptional regulator with XRE-family HTH domain
MPTSFWDRVNALIKERKMTQESLAEAADVKYQTLRNWSAREIFPQAPEAFRIASALGTTVEFLVTGAEPANRAAEKLEEIANILAK